MRYLTVDELIYINEQLPAREQIHKILKGRQKVRDMSLLEAAAGRPQQSVFGADAYPTLAEKAAALLHSLTRNHPFADGNKRTATIALLFMLAVNGFTVTWEPAEALEEIIATAEGRRNVEQFATWLTLMPDGAPQAQDAATDTATIAHIMRAHDWLLTELAAR